jgi:hypothetical protein
LRSGPDDRGGLLPISRAGMREQEEIESQSSALAREPGQRPSSPARLRGMQEGHSQRNVVAKGEPGSQIVRPERNSFEIGEHLNTKVAPYTATICDIVLRRWPNSAFKPCGAPFLVAWREVITGAVLGAAAPYAVSAFAQVAPTKVPLWVVALGLVAGCSLTLAGKGLAKWARGRRESRLKAARREADQFQLLLEIRDTLRLRGGPSEEG